MLCPVLQINTSCYKTVMYPTQVKPYHGFCYTSRGALAGTRNSSMGPPHEGSIQQPTAP